MTTENSMAHARFRSLSQLSDCQLKTDLHQLNQKGFRLDAELLLLLGELDQRRLFREEACSSAFGFCVTRMGHSEDVAYKRVGAARLMRQFPRIYDLLAEGRIHLTALMLLKSHLTVENHQEWLLAACNKSKREVEMLVASRCPTPDAAASVRKLPSAKPAPVPTSVLPTAARQVPRPLTPAEEAASQTKSAAESTGAFDLSSAPLAVTPRVGSAASAASAPSARQPAQVAPLSSSRYQVTFTASEQLKQKLDRARELLSHCVPPSDLPALIERALDQLLEREQTRRYGGNPKRKPAEILRQECAAKSQREMDGQSLKDEGSVVKSEARGRNLDPDPRDSDAGVLTGINVAAANATADATATAISGRRRRPKVAVRRAVFERDAGQCTFVDRQGRRCDQRHFLEFDHIEAYAIGGDETESNLRLRCKSHNIFEAEQLFGQKRVKDAIAQARQCGSR